MEGENSRNFHICRPAVFRVLGVINRSIMITYDLHCGPVLPGTVFCPKDTDLYVGMYVFNFL
jgi:hypothetical protein